MERSSYGRWSLIAGFLALLVSTTNLVAQTGTSSLHGTVTDANAASVAGATVVISSPEIGVTLTTKTDRDGVYQFLEVRPSTYVLTVTASGFQTLKQSGVILPVATPVTNDLKLQVGS